ncbi:peptidoglycan DD-metalloendopeptidase family protein [Buchnera aphidicola]|uniref:LysM peptidoglycan-binding domain-containing protein n=1 Tax=Buchnera aphidicola (Artemisaphis artemisicola) TaxID=1241836 RepID=A0A4D6XQ96_9GAMM|nr:peptidoglycan DD-metalloendopeptidase family protein [Buchnera aphidicola]QCI16081.1 LysM peptidoglycan-binding domain-containing protein [Buchnera aphidicola (Artemisaphis artemisicola)]
MFFLIFLLFFFNNFSFSSPILNKNNLNIYSQKKNVKTLIFSKKNECFSFLQLTKIFSFKKQKIIISNNNFIGFFEQNKFKIFYIVKSKDTLYSISKKSGNNYHELAEANFIKKPYKIIIGQKIWVGDVFINKNIDNCSIITSELNSIKSYHFCDFFKTPLSVLNFLNKSIFYNTKICFFCNKDLQKNNNLVRLKSFIFDNHWNWPIQSEQIKYFYEDSLEGNVKIEIFGFKGQPVFSAAAGEVLCVIESFEKYGRLIIIKHNENYFSIYGFNDLVLVKPKEKVYAKQQIATMGLSPEKKIPQLYFEIRYKGNSINPLDILPNVKK